MGGTAKDFGSFMKVLMNSKELCDLMLIPIEEQSNYSKMLTDYFVETYTSDTITTTSVCRLIIRSAPQSSTNSVYIKEDNLVIEVYVPSSKDRVAGFERRINQIADRLINIFNRQLVNDRKLNLEARHELASGIPGFQRYYLQFSYKRIYS